MNGCYNRPPPKLTAIVQDGWYTMRGKDSDGRKFESRTPLMRTVPVPMTKDCVYSKTTPDEKCLGCKWNQQAA